MTPDVSSRSSVSSDLMPLPLIVALAVEAILNQTEATDETKDFIRHQVSSYLMSQRPHNVLPKVERDALKELRANNDFVIAPANEKRSTVVMDRTDYIQKTKRPLEDRQSYAPCESNPIRTGCPLAQLLATRRIHSWWIAEQSSGKVSCEISRPKSDE
nr:unnamed protein product [Spirometra erinaceieuropaei]